jgi:hypothetical protein
MSTAWLGAACATAAVIVGMGPATAGASALDTKPLAIPNAMIRILVIDASVSK